MSANDYTFILKGRKIVPVLYLEWALWFEDIKNRQVGSTYFPGGRVSTVFLGVGPIYFETMVFGGVMNEWQWRYDTYDEALRGHRQVVKNVQLINRLKHKYI